ncbi:MAG TPA: thioredoxin family protein [Blastocatellia bacterium]|nr:thioredoxin family protein [Blastocatellia bacterium]
MRRISVSALAAVLLTGCLVASGQSQQQPAPHSVPRLTNDDITGARAAAANPESVESVVSPDASHGNPASVPTSISWQTELARAREMAADSKGVVVADVYTDWCGWCKRMDEVIYSNPKVAALGSRDVFLKLNAEDHGEGEEIANRYGINSYPTTLIFDAEGNLINSAKGFISSPDVFVSFVRHAQPH